MQIQFPKMQSDFFNDVNARDKDAAARWINKIFDQLETKGDIDAFVLSWSAACDDVKLAALYLADSKAPMSLDWATPKTPPEKFNSYQRSLIVRALAKLGHGCSVTCGQLLAAREVVEGMSSAKQGAA